MTTLLKTSEEVAAEIKGRLDAILVTNSCETNIGTKVFQGRRKINNDEVPCAVLIEGEDTVTDLAGRQLTDARLAQRYVLIGYDACDPENPNVKAHAMIRDLKRAIYKTAGVPSGNLGGAVRAVRYQGRDIGPRADGVAIVMAIVEIVVEFSEDLANP